MNPQPAEPVDDEIQQYSLARTKLIERREKLRLEIAEISRILGRKSLGNEKTQTISIQVLTILSDGESHRPKDIAETLQVQQNQVATTLNNMKNQQKFVKRVGRGIYRITESGRDHLKSHPVPTNQGGEHEAITDATNETPLSDSAAENTIATTL